ncbi:MAG: 50S ribosomal protein L24 [Deltaproteobacteria bacterium]|jgi:large subunit ribosomal protein L24|nr:50S ribosomal protein L24 [Deltaproteobacteria bacterium]
MPRSIFRKKPYKNPEGLKICPFKKGDRVQVLSGKCRDKVGQILQIRTKDGQVTIEGLNMVSSGKSKQRAKQDAKKYPETFPAPLAVSNVAFICPHCSKPTRLGHEFLPPDENSVKPRKVRVCRRCKRRVDD